MGEGDCEEGGTQGLTPNGGFASPLGFVPGP